jgi:hypothetical protein
MMVGIENKQKSVLEKQFSAQWKKPSVAMEMRNLEFLTPEKFGSSDGNSARNMDF